MKKTLFILMALCLSISVFSQGTEADDNENGTSLSPIMKDVEPLIQELEKEGLEIVRVEIDIVKTSKTTLRLLHEGWSYGIAVTGDYRFTDMDVKVYKKNGDDWDLIMEDTDDEKTAVVIVEPTSTEEYLIEIIAAEYVEGYSGGHYALLIFHE